MPTTSARPRTQIDRAIAAMEGQWLGPADLCSLSGRQNPNGLARDARPVARRRGWWWHERWVTEGGHRFKLRCVTRGPTPPGGPEGVTSWPPAGEAERRRLLERPLARTAEHVASLRRREPVACASGNAMQSAREDDQGRLW